MNHIYWPGLFGFVIIPIILVVWILWDVVKGIGIWLKNRKHP